MVAARVAFDPVLPVVAAADFTYDESHAFTHGDAVDWRELGMSEGDLFNLWRAGLVAFQPTTEAATVVVETPGVASAEAAQQLDRRERRFNKHRR